MPLYFAYGANMDVAMMAARAPRTRLIGQARLPRRRVALMADGLATLVNDPARDAYGLLWDLALSDVAALDRFENVAQGLYVKLVQPVLPVQGAARRALVYVGRAAASANPKPLPGYLDAIVLAARAAELPKDHIAALACLGGRAYLGANPHSRAAKGTRTDR